MKASSNKPVIILVHTQLAVNIGMCARAMLNCGLVELRLVAPRDGWPNPDAISPSTEAYRVIENAKVFATVAEAVADCHQVFAATARSRHLSTPALTDTESVAKIHSETKVVEGYRAGILFGPEASGLDNESISHADHLMHFPMNPDYTSLNLAQAVLLFAWRWWDTREEAVKSYEPTVKLAEKGKVDHFLNRLETELDSTRFFSNQSTKPATLQKLRTYLGRSNPTEQELAMLQGMLTALMKK